MILINLYHARAGRITKTTPRRPAGPGRFHRPLLHTPSAPDQTQVGGSPAVYRYRHRAQVHCLRGVPRSARGVSCVLRSSIATHACARGHCRTKLHEALHRLVLRAVHCHRDGGLAILVLACVDVSSSIEQDLYDINVAALARSHQCGESMLILGVHLRLSLQQQLDGLHVSSAGGYSDQEKAALEKRINTYLKEIDHCLTLLK